MSRHAVAQKHLKMQAEDDSDHNEDVDMDSEHEETQTDLNLDERIKAHEKAGLDTSKVEKRSKWYEHPALRIDQHTFKKPAPRPEHAVTVEELRKEGEAALATLVKTGQRDRLMARADQKWVDELLKTGTLTDKISALTLQIRNHPFQSNTSLEHLLGYARKKGRRETLIALEALQDLFVSELIPPNRKLKLFQNQLWVKGYVFHSEHPKDTRIPSTHQFAHKPSSETLALWVLEDQIKTHYHGLLEIIETGLHDPIDYIKRKFLTTANSLLTQLPEGEEVLLSLIVNKMGDSNRAIATKAEFMLRKLLQSNPGMRIAVIQEIERLLFRPHIKDRAQYYALSFLNQLMYTDNDSKLAQALIRIYFSLFRALVARSNRAREQAARLSRMDEKKKKVLKKKRQSKQKVNPEKAKLTEEVKALGITNKLLSALLIGINRAFPYATTGESPEEEAKLRTVMEEHTEMLFGIVSQAQDNFMMAIQAMMLLYQVMTARDTLTGRYYMALYKLLISPMILTTNKQTLFLNLLFKSVKNDKDEKRVLGFVKRMAQIALVCAPNFGCSLLFVISEVAKYHKYVLDFTADVDLNIRETYRLMQEKRKELEVQFGDATEAELDEKLSALYTELTAAAPEHGELDPKKLYDGTEGDAHYARAENTAFWELLVLAAHYHPSLALFARTILNGEDIVYKGNPLVDYTRQAFLDRFTQRKPKSAEDVAKVSEYVNQSHSSKSRLIAESNLRDLSKLSVQAEQIDEANVREDDRFILKFFQNRKALETERASLELRKDQGQVYELEDGEDLEDFADRLINEEMSRLQKADEPEDDLDYDAFAEALDEEGLGYDANEDDENEDDEFDFDNDDIEAVDEDEDIILDGDFDDEDDEEESKMGAFDDDYDDDDEDDDDIESAKSRHKTSKFVSADDLKVEKLMKKHGGLELPSKASKLKSVSTKSKQSKYIMDEEEEEEVMDDFKDFGQDDDDDDDDQGVFADDPLTSAARFGQMLEDTQTADADRHQQAYYDSLNSGKSMRRKKPLTQSKSSKQPNQKRRK